VEMALQSTGVYRAADSLLVKQVWQNSRLAEWPGEP